MDLPVPKHLNIQLSKAMVKRTQDVWCKGSWGKKEKQNKSPFLPEFRRGEKGEVK